ncbi:MAG: bifunctional adenosylcobinamide kinase/adenosylcobinamide-phosphate guanylyltransferase [Nitrospirae bacterium]|nr:bifunctional adenosylcobinamide kinase/adenosylcobinamide-phosphate guanylyltransferase [Nitrospirota bacterium]
MKIIFVIGGTRSGKSSFALNEASNYKGQKAYIATAEALDKGMKERIEKHKKSRGDGWDTIEEPLKISDVLAHIRGKYNIIVLDCLTLWLSNLIHNNSDINREIKNLIKVLQNSELPGLAQRSGAGQTLNSKLFVVSNEVGMGIVPDNELARRFRDFAGLLNQKIAEIADEVYLVTAGIPVKIKNSK